MKGSTALQQGGGIQSISNSGVQGGWIARLCALGGFGSLCPVSGPSAQQTLVGLAFESSLPHGWRIGTVIRCVTSWHEPEDIRGRCWAPHGRNRYRPQCTAREKGISDRRTATHSSIPAPCAPHSPPPQTPSTHPQAARCATPPAAPPCQ